MNRYSTTFASLKKENRIGFCPFAALGDPNEKECLKRIKIYLEAKPDFLELGIPFSDPIADGPVIQAADERALRAGITPKKAIELVKKIRSVMVREPPVYALRASAGRHHDIPIGILTYSNIVFRYGISKFYRDLKRAGADSILIADVPLEEIKPFASASKKYGLHQIMLVSEYTDLKRLRQIEKYASGFLYVVSVLGVTGSREKINKNTLKLVKKLKQQTKLPLSVGFGISKPEHIIQLHKAGADGAIVGSALVDIRTPHLAKILRRFSR